MKKKKLNVTKIKVNEIKDSTLREIPHVNNNRIVLVCITIILAVTFILFQNTFKHGFVLDDDGIIFNNKITMTGISADNIHTIFTTAHREGSTLIEREHSLYRPLTKTMFLVCWQFSKGNSSAFHMMNVTMYALTCLLIFMVLYHATRKNWCFSLIATLLFLSHPLHSEVVANNKSLDEIMSVLGLFIVWRAIQLHSNTRTSFRYFWLFTAFLGCLIALFSKENLIVMIGLVPLFVYQTIEFDKKEKIINLLGIQLPIKKIALYSSITIFSSLLFLLARHYALSQYAMETTQINPWDNVLGLAKSQLDRESTAITLLGKYLVFLLLPIKLSSDYSYSAIKPTLISDPYFFLSFIVISGLLVYALYRLPKRDWIGFGILLFIISVSIVSNIFIPIGSSFGDRLMFLPSLGWSVSVTGILFLIGKKKVAKPVSSGIIEGIKKFNTIIIPGLIITALFGFKTIQRNADWKSSETLIQADIKKYPESAHLQINYANILVQPKSVEGKSTEEMVEIKRMAIEHYEKAIAILPSTLTSSYYDNLYGMAYYYLKRYDKAMALYYKAYLMDSNNADILNNIGTIKFETSMMPNYQNSAAGLTLLDSAQYFFSKACRLDSTKADYMNNMGAVLGQKGRLDEAILWFLKAYHSDTLATSAINSLQSIGMTYQIKRDERLSTYYYQKAQELKKYRGSLPSK